MTICVAAIGNTGLIVAAADRMKTGGDVEFEPRKDANQVLIWGNGSKVLPITNSIAVLTAGDSGLQSEIVHHVFLDVASGIKREPNNWWLIEDVVNLYVHHYDRIKRERANSALLSPLGLESNSFIKNPDLVDRIGRDLQTFEMPNVQALILGVDPQGSHIWVTDNCNNDYICERSSFNNTGFAAVGSGSRHALSQFMQVGYHRQAPTSETLFQTYLAKKRAEAAPGVGEETDFFVIGPKLGVSGFVGSEVMAGLDKIYNSYHKSEIALRDRASEKAAQFEREILERLPKEQSAEAANS